MHMCFTAFPYTHITLSDVTSAQQLFIAADSGTHLDFVAKWHSANREARNSRLNLYRLPDSAQTTGIRRFIQSYNSAVEAREIAVKSQLNDYTADFTRVADELNEMRKHDTIPLSPNWLKSHDHCYLTTLRMKLVDLGAKRIAFTRSVNESAYEDEITIKKLEQMISTRLTPDRFEQLWVSARHSAEIYRDMNTVAHDDVELHEYALQFPIGLDQQRQRVVSENMITTQYDIYCAAKYKLKQLELANAVTVEDNIRRKCTQQQQDEVQKQFEKTQIALNKNITIQRRKLDQLTPLLWVAIPLLSEIGKLNRKNLESSPCDELFDCGLDEITIENTDKKDKTKLETLVVTAQLSTDSYNGTVTARLVDGGWKIDTLFIQKLSDAMAQLLRFWGACDSQR